MFPAGRHSFPEPFWGSCCQRGVGGGDRGASDKVTAALGGALLGAGTKFWPNGHRLERFRISVGVM